MCRNNTLTAQKWGISYFVQRNKLCSRMYFLVCVYVELGVNTMYLPMHMYMYMRGSAIFEMASKMVHHGAANFSI
jgi:hypothetical protein